MLLRVWTLLAVVAGVSVVAQQPQRQEVAAASAGGAGALLQLAAPVSDLSSALRKRNVKGDNQALATGFTGHGHHGHHHHGGHHLGHGHHGHGKFFMYAHQPEHKHYEFGFKRGNDKHVVERYEKGGPHHHFKSKFRWHDKHGGHGERYWDYNHGPHHHDDGGDSGHHHHHDDGHHHHGDDGGDDDDGHHHDHHHHSDGHHHGYSEPVPEFVQPEASFKPESYRQRRKSSDSPSKEAYYKKPTGMGKKKFVGPKEQQLFPNPPMMLAPQPQPQPKNPDSEMAINDMLGFDPFSPPEIMKDHSSVGGIDSDASTPDYRVPATTLTPPMSKPYFSRNSGKKMKNKYNQEPSSDNAKTSSDEVPKLAFDLDSGKVFDEKTGKWFSLVAD